MNKKPHKYLEHHTYTGPGCCVCGKLEEDHDPSSKQKHVGICYCGALINSEEEWAEHLNTVDKNPTAGAGDWEPGTHRITKKTQTSQ